MLAQSWSEAAEEYEAQLVPRFDPWTQDALAQLSAHADALPDGAVVVPCMGPGQELPLEAEAVGPERQVIGSDLAPGMVERAQVHAAEAGPQCTAIVRDAMEPLCDGKAACMLTCFGLQQLPDPVAAVTAWCQKLEPAGVAVVLFWPPGGVETEGPWATYSRLLSSRVGSEERKQPTAVWDQELRSAAAAGGAEVLMDSALQHTMEWPDGDACFEAMSRGGPWHATRLRRGGEFMEIIKRDFLAVHGPGVPLSHTPTARLMVLRRAAAGTQSKQ